MSVRFDPRDPSLVDQIVHEVKSQGVFDEFRKSSIADVDTKPAYQNLRQRVENTVKKFLSEQEWTPETNKIQMREKLRKHIQEANFLDVGVERIVDQVVNPKIATVFRPRIEEIAYKFLGLPPPEKPESFQPLLHTMPGLPINGVGLHVKTENLLPTDLEQVSPESDLKEEPMDLENSDEESPPFEPLQKKTKVETESKSLDETDPEVGSTPVYQGDDSLSNSGSSIIQKDDTSSAFNVDPIKDASQSFDANNSQESQLSRISNSSNATPGKASSSKDTTVNISEEAQMPKFSDNFSKTEPNDENTDFHFDIKKDEIKFEGTERKPCLENDSKENEDIKNNSITSKDCGMNAPMKVETPANFEFTKTATIITKSVDEAIKMKVDEVEQHISSSIDDSRSTQNLLIDETPLADQTTTDETTTFNTPSFDSATTPQEESNISKVPSSSSSRHKHSKSRYHSHDKDSKSSRNRGKDYDRGRDRDKSRDSKRDKDKEHDKNRKDRDKKDNKDKDKDRERDRSRQQDRDRDHRNKSSDNHNSSTSSKKESSSSSHRYKSSSHKSSKSDKDSRSVSHSKNNTPTSTSSSSRVDDTKRQKEDKDREKDRHHDKSRRHGDNKSSRKYTSSSSKSHSTHKSKTKNDDHYEKKFKLSRRSSNDSNDENKGDEKKLNAPTNGNKSSNDHPSDPQISNGKNINSEENVKADENTSLKEKDDESFGETKNGAGEIESFEPKEVEMDMDIKKSEDVLQTIPVPMSQNPKTEQLITESDDATATGMDPEYLKEDISTKKRTDIQLPCSFATNQMKNKEEFKNEEVDDEKPIETFIKPIECKLEQKQEKENDFKMDDDIEMETLTRPIARMEEPKNDFKMTENVEKESLPRSIECEQEQMKGKDNDFKMDIDIEVNSLTRPNDCKQEQEEENDFKTDVNMEAENVTTPLELKEEKGQVSGSNTPNGIPHKQEERKAGKHINTSHAPKDIQKMNEELKDIFENSNEELSIIENVKKGKQDKNIDSMKKNDEVKISRHYMSDEDFLGFESDSSEQRKMSDFLKRFEQLQFDLRNEFSSHHAVATQDVYFAETEDMTASKESLSSEHENPSNNEPDNDQDVDEATNKKKIKEQRDKKTNNKNKNMKKPIKELHIECEEKNEKGKESPTNKRGKSGQPDCKNKPSPTPSDSSSNSKENERFDKNTDQSKDNKRRTRSSRKLTEQQRYTSEDLYKPRPVLSQRSRRRNLPK